MVSCMRVARPLGVDVPQERSERMVRRRLNGLYHENDVVSILVDS